MKNNQYNLIVDCETKEGYKIKLDITFEKYTSTTFSPNKPIKDHQFILNQFKSWEISADNFPF